MIKTPIKLAAPDGKDYVIYCACGERLETHLNPKNLRIEVYCQACIDGAAANDQQEATVRIEKLETEADKSVKAALGEET